jgi:hypothetical protein
MKIMKKRTLRKLQQLDETLVTDIGLREIGKTNHILLTLINSINYEKPKLGIDLGFA